MYIYVPFILKLFYQIVLHVIIIALHLPISVIAKYIYSLRLFIKNYQFNIPILLVSDLYHSTKFRLFTQSGFEVCELKLKQNSSNNKEMKNELPRCLILVIF